MSALKKTDHRPNLKVVDDDFDAMDAELEQRRHESHDDHDDMGTKKVEEGEGPWIVSYADMMTLLMGFFALLASMSKPDAAAVDKVQKSAAEKFGGEYKEPYKDLENKLEATLKKQGQEMKVSVSRGVDGVTLKFEGTSLFDSGAFEVKKEGSDTISTLMDQIKNEIPKYKITVEGHTDNVPMSHPIIASNWELSAIRAARVAAIIQAKGFKKEQITIQGWGETKPEVPNEGPDGVAIPENQAKNRRVILKISE